MTAPITTDCDDTPAAEVEHVPTVVIPHPDTGEAIEVIRTTTSDVLADVRDRLLDSSRQIDSWKRAIDRELTARLDYEGTRSADVDGEAGAFKLSVVAPQKTQWDGAAAWRALQRLVRAGLISKDRMHASVERVVSFKPKHAQLEQLTKHADERVRDAITACRATAEVTDRRVTVTRKPGGPS